MGQRLEGSFLSLKWSKIMGFAHYTCWTCWNQNTQSEIRPEEVAFTWLYTDCISKVYNLLLRYYYLHYQFLPLFYCSTGGCCALTCILYFQLYIGNKIGISTCFRLFKIWKLSSRFFNLRNLYFNFLLADSMNISVGLLLPYKKMHW